MRRRIAHGLAIAFMIVGLGAAQGPNISEAKAAPVSSVQKQPEVRQQVARRNRIKLGQRPGTARYFEGKPTASGEPYEMYDMTAAHLTLPMGSYVKVTNLRNGRAVVVRVNDRGPDRSRPDYRPVVRCRPSAAIQVSVVCSACVWIWSTPSDQKPVYQTVAVNHPPVAKLP